MTDIAQLGLAIDSTQVVRAGSALDAFQQTANTAAAGADKLNVQAKSATTAVDKLGMEAKDASTGLQAITAASVTAAAGIAKIAAAANTDFMAKFSNDLTAAIGQVNDSMAVGAQRADQLRSKYVPLAAAQASYKQQLGDLKDAYASGALSQDEYKSALTDIKVAFVGQMDVLKPGVKVFQDTAEASDEVSHSHAGLSTQAMAAQHSIRSLVEAMASGQPISMALGQQLNHLSYAATGPGGITAAFKQAGGALLGLINPTTAVIGGTAALAIGFALSAASILKSEKALDDLAHQSDTSVKSLRDLQTAAAFKGIDSGDFAKSMEQFSGSVADAKHGMGGLADTFRANNTSAQTFTEYLEKAADLIKGAGDDQQRLQLLQQMGLPATMDWVRFLSQGKEGIEAAMASGAKFNEFASADMVAAARRFDESWNSAWRNFSTGAKSAVVTAVGAIQKLKEANDSGDKQLSFFGYTPVAKSPNSRVNGGFAAASSFSATSALTNGLQNKAAQLNGTPATVNPAVAQHNIQIQQQQIALYGQTATVEEALKSVDLQLQAAKLQGVTIDQKRIDALRELTAEQAIGTAQIKAQTDSEKINAATIGMSAEAAAQYTAVQTALNAAKQIGKVLTQDNIDSINKEAAALAAATSQTKALTLVNSIAPAGAAIKEATNSLELLTKAMNDPAFEAFRQKVGDQLPLALQRLQNQASSFTLNPRLADPIQSQIDSLNLQNKALSDQSPAMRQRIEYQTAYNEAVKQGASAEEAVALATARGKAAYGGVATDISLQQQQLGLYGQTVTALEAVKQIDLQVQAARLQGVTVDQKRIDTLKQLAVEQNIGTAQIKAQTDSEKINAATVGMSAEATAQYTAVQNALNAAKQSGKILYADDVMAINKEAAALGEAAKRTDLLKFSFDNLVQGPLETFTSAIAQGATAMDALKQAASSALGSIAKKLADMAAQNLWSAAFGGSSGGGLMGLLGLGGGSSGGTGNFTQIAAPGGGTMPFAAAGGGTFGAGSWGVVGEKGPELIKVGMGKVTVIPNHISKPYLPGFATGGTMDSAGNVTRLPFGQNNSPGAGGGQHTHVTVGVSVDNDGNLQAMIKNVSTQTVNDFANSPQFPNHVAKASNTARARNLGR